MKALIVDDDIVVCDGLMKIIPWNELDVEIVGSAQNGEDAYKIALSERPDLIISDIKMPIMDGIELCKKVYETMADTHIILLSAHEDFEYARTAMKYGVKSYILKPVDREKINQLVENIKAVSEVVSNKKKFYSTIYSKDIENDFYEALKNSNNAFVVDFFENQLPSLSINSSEVKELCIKLVNLLFEYIKSIGFSSNLVVASRESSLEELYDKKTKKDIEFYTLQLYLDLLQLTSEKKDSRADSIIEYVKKYINENYIDANLSVSFIADNLNLSAAYLSVIFRQVAGINISTYISDLRVGKACELLNNPALKMTDICNAVGYQDSHYFSKVFKKIVGVTPSEYRNLKLCN